MIEPNEWEMEFIGSFRLSANDIWERINQKKNTRLLISNFYLQ